MALKDHRQSDAECSQEIPLFGGETA